MMIHSDTISAAKALNPVKTIPHRQKKPVLYAQLAESIQELATTPDQKNSKKQLVHHMFSKLVVYNSVDPSLARSLLMLHQQCEDWNVLRYVYYYLARILSDSGAQGFSAGGGIPTPNWDALADIDAGGGVTRADVVPGMVNEFPARAGTDAPDVEEENITSKPSVTYEDTWAKTLLESYEAEEVDARSSGTSSPELTGSVETSILSHFGGMNYPSLFSLRLSDYGVAQQSENRSASRFSGSTPSSAYEELRSPVREGPPSYSTPVMQIFESFENPLAGHGVQSFGSQNKENIASENPQFGKALYDFTAGGDDEFSIDAEEELEIDYEVDGWYYVKKKRPGRDGKMA